MIKHETEALEIGQEYYSPSIVNDCDYSVRQWKGSNHDLFMLEHDQVYLNHDDAVEHMVRVKAAILKRDLEKFKRMESDLTVKRGETISLPLAETII